MNLLKKQLMLFGACLIITVSASMAQPMVKLTFQGMLTDIQGNHISNEQFKLSISILSIPDENILWQENTISLTDDEGWFGFNLNDITPYLINNGEMNQALSVNLNFMPNENTRWMRKGEDFLVSYSITPIMKNDSLDFEMTRMEGSALTIHKDKHLIAFKDEYPFAYLTGGFVLTDKPVDDAASDLQQWISPVEEVDEGRSTRGVKGGFPAGGYRKNKNR